LIIILDDERLRRKYLAIDADQAEWECIREKLLNVMIAASGQPIGLTSATLSALLDVLQDEGQMSFAKAKAAIAKALQCFHDHRLIEG